jgi:chorismate dehydratase
MNKPRIAASTYLNSLPLCSSFLFGSQSQQCEFIKDVAAASCADLLRRGDVEAALIPSIEYQRIEDIVIVPDIAVAVKGEVRSVILLSKKPLDEIQSVALDLSSRTAAALTQIYFRHFQQREVVYRTDPPELDVMLRETDAALLIGDPALLANFHNQHLRVYDWGNLWMELTGKPFVFAIWAVRKASLPALEPVDFGQVKKDAAASLNRIIDDAANRLRLPYEYVQEYLTKCIHYDLDTDCLEGLKLFYELAHQVGLIEQVKPIEFLRQPER